MACNDDVLHLKNFDGVLQNSNRADIRWRDDVGYISEYEHFSIIQAQYFISWHSRIRTTHPKILGSLSEDMANEEIGVLAKLFISPFGVVLQYCVEICEINGWVRQSFLICRILLNPDQLLNFLIQMKSVLYRLELDLIVVLVVHSYYRYALLVDDHLLMELDLFLDV